jgi:hypothetical protein
MLLILGYFLFHQKNVFKKVLIACTGNGFVCHTPWGCGIQQQRPLPPQKGYAGTPYTTEY